MVLEFIEQGNCSAIFLSANFASGNKTNLFSISPSFFGAVQKDRDTPDEEAKSYQVTPLYYNPETDLVEFKSCADRSYEFFDPTIAKDDILISFDAHYGLGYIVPTAKTFAFSRKFFNSKEERLQLEIDVDERNQWILNLYQPGNNILEQPEAKPIPEYCTAL
jgi:hypothetical protein